MKKVLVAAGGTGGHIFPALAVAKQLAGQGVTVEWIGTADRLEAQLVPQHGFKIHFIEAKGLVSLGLKQRLQAIGLLAKSFFTCRSLLKAEKPDLVICMGGYVCGAVGLAARSLGVPLLLHEQNSVMGLTNKWLQKLAATKTLSAFPLPVDQVVGQPLRAEFDQVDFATATKKYWDAFDTEWEVVGAHLRESNSPLLSQWQAVTDALDEIDDEQSPQAQASLTTQEQTSQQPVNHKPVLAVLDQAQALLQKLDGATWQQVKQEVLAQHPLNVLVVGGSQGAQVLNRVVPVALAQTLASLNLAPANLQVTHQVGKHTPEAQVQQAYQDALKDVFKDAQKDAQEDASTELAAQVVPDATNYHTQVFIDDMVEKYQQADVIICRSGAMTVFEIGKIGRPVVFVPFGGHKDQQQARNARFLSEAQAATLMLEPDFNVASLTEYLVSLSATSMLSQALRQHELVPENATATIAKIAHSLMEK